MRPAVNMLTQATRTAIIPGMNDIAQTNSPLAGEADVLETPPQEPVEYSVSELSGIIRARLEKGFERVRVRGELGRVTRAPSGHLYLDIKDNNALLNAVMWRQQASALTFPPETGMEALCIGRLSTYPPRSTYQLVLESIQPAGEGALMAMLEKRRKKLAAEGLFAEERKRPIPYLPRVIGVVTSPGGAVIHDILHRLSHRFPRHVLVWPARMQGEECAAEVAAAIAGFNALPEGGAVPRPDVLIVARGGGSLEDLWPFNDEALVRAAAASAIPLVSAVGHESDTTLIDYAADRRAPTPSAAAEMSVPVRADLLADAQLLARRAAHAMERRLQEAGERLSGTARHIRRSADILALLSQRFDMVESRLGAAFARTQEARVRHFSQLRERILAHTPEVLLARAEERLAPAAHRLRAAADALLATREEAWRRHGGLLEAVSHRRILERGFALVWSGARLLTRAGEAKPGMRVSLEFAGEQRVSARIDGNGSERKQKPKQDPLFS